MLHWNDLNAVSHAPKRYLGSIVMGFLISTCAMAQNLGTIFTDLWWIPTESGWGVTVDHQQNTMFLTFFIYRADGSPYWVTAQLQKVGTTGLGSSPQVFSGNVYETHGPWFGGPFNPAAVTVQSVGTATFTSTGLNAATLQYSVSGVNVTKAIQRQTLVNVNYSGQYLGFNLYTSSNCANPANNGVTTADPAILTVVQTGTSFQITAQGQSTTCTFNGTYSQQGLIGAVNGTFSCSDGTSGPFTLIGIQWTLFGMTAGVSRQGQTCAYTGYLGGVTGNHLAP